MEERVEADEEAENVAERVAVFDSAEREAEGVKEALPEPVGLREFVGEAVPDRERVAL
jgi:hypothetical protein